MVLSVNFFFVIYIHLFRRMSSKLIRTICTKLYIFYIDMRSISLLDLKVSVSTLSGIQ